jgi:anti-sigma regulatory factor (Ser/Thr protein kinase)
LRIVTVQDVPQFRHQGLPYESSELLLEQVTGFLGPALDREEPVLIAAQSDTLAGFRTAFIGKRTHIDLAPMEQVGRNPGRLISIWADFLDRHGAAGRTVWGIGEPIYAGRDQAEIEESEMYEQLLNGAFTELEFSLHLGCPFDTASLPGSVLDDLTGSHPFLSSGAISRTNENFLANGHPERPLSPALIDDDAFVPFTEHGLSSMRKRLAEDARRLGVEEARIPDLVLAVNEIATNSVTYTGSGSLGVWQAGGRIVCEVRDLGFIEDQLIGLRRPKITEERGRGIWFAHQVSDLIQLRSSPSGTTVRILFDCVSTA